jgi:hypothetical protein
MISSPLGVWCFKNKKTPGSSRGFNVLPTPGEFVLRPGNYLQWSGSRTEAPKAGKKPAPKGRKYGDAPKPSRQVGDRTRSR